MKGIANRQNTLLGRKPVLFGGGRPSPVAHQAGGSAEARYRRRLEPHQSENTPRPRRLPEDARLDAEPETVLDSPDSTMSPGPEAELPEKKEAET